MSRATTAEEAGALVHGRLLASIAEAVAPLVLVRLLGKEDVGALTGILLVYNTLAMVLTSGLPNSASFFLPARSDPDRRAIAFRVGRVMTALGAGAAGVLAVLGLLGHAGVTAADLRMDLCLLLALFPLGDVPLRLLPNVLVVEGRPRTAASLSALRSLAVVGATLLPIAAGGGLASVAVALSAAGAGFLALTWRLLGTSYRGVAKDGGAPAVSEILRFGLPLGLTDIVNNVNGKLDRFLVLPLGALAFAEYGAGSWQFPLIPGIAYSVGVAYAPRLAEHYKAGRPREGLEVWRHQAKKTSLLVVPLSMLFIVAAEETIELLFTEDYLRGAWVFRLYAILTLARITSFGIPLVAAGRPGLIVRASLASLALNAVVSVPCLLLFGFLGPAIGSLVAYVPQLAVYCRYIAEVSGVHLRETFPLFAWLRVVSVAALAATPALLFKLGVEAPAAVKLAGEAAILFGTFAVAGTLTGLLGREEWRFALRWLSFRFGGAR